MRWNRLIIKATVFIWVFNACLAITSAQENPKSAPPVSPYAIPPKLPPAPSLPPLTEGGVSLPPAPTFVEPKLPPLPKQTTLTTPKIVTPKEVPTPLPKASTLPTISSPGSSELQSLPRMNNTSVLTSPTGRQEPSVSLEWVGATTTKIGRASTFQILVKNTGNTDAQQVTVRHKLPQGVKLQKTSPEGSSHEDTWIWNLGTLQPGQQKRIELEYLPQAQGELACTATVTFSGTSTARLRVREPKLVLKAQSPKSVLVGDTVVLALTVSNPGDGTSERVKLKTTLPDTLSHPQGKALEVEIGDLGPNETRSVQLVCTAKGGGTQNITFKADGNDGLTTSTKTKFEVIMPKLKLVATGPRLRYVDRPAIYNIKVSNEGSATATNVSVNEYLPQGFKFVAATAGGRHDVATRTISWFVGDLQPGQSREVSMKVIAAKSGEHQHRVTALAARGIKQETSITTRVEGLAASLIELVDSEDPIEVGAETTYEVTITNTGSKADSNLQLVCTIPSELELISAQGPAGIRSEKKGTKLVFEKLPTLAPRADAVYRIKVRGIAVGDVRFRAEITAGGLSKPVIKEESTKVYGDELLPVKK